MFYLYILQSEKNNKFYIGSTANLSDRISRHNSARSKATAKGVPWKLVYTEEFNTRSEAMKREYEIKAWRSHKLITNLINSKL